MVYYFILVIEDFTDHSEKNATDVPRVTAIFLCTYRSATLRHQNQSKIREYDLFKINVV